MKSKRSFIYKNSLTLILLVLFLGSFTGQILTGWKEYNNERSNFHQDEVSFTTYLSSGHFYQTTFENWESEFLQMGLYVVLTIWFRQIGSSESKGWGKKEKVDREPVPNTKDAPWPVKKGGVILKIYKNSLSLAFLFLFSLSFIIHALGSFRNYNEQQIFEGRATVSFSHFIGRSRFWFESFQNWQSEFVAVISIVVLSIYLRQKGSPESKPVDAPFYETGS